MQMPTAHSEGPDATNARVADLFDVRQISLAPLYTWLGQPRSSRRGFERQIRTHSFSTPQLPLIVGNQEEILVCPTYVASAQLLVNSSEGKGEIRATTPMQTELTILSNFIKVRL